MVRCERCDGYVSRDYARVFGDNQNVVTSCRNCPTEWDDGSERIERDDERKLTFRMSEFDSSEPTETDENESGIQAESTGDAGDRDGGRFGRVGRAVSGLF